jgi:hypothetical protein
MNVIIWTPRNDELAARLDGEGVIVGLMEYDMLVYPPWKGNVFLLPDGVEGDVMLVATESGTGHSKNGKARVICKINGEPMKVFRSFTRTQQGFEGLATQFMAMRGLVSVDSTRRSCSVSVTRHLIEINGNTISIKHEPVAVKLPVKVHWQCLMCGDIEGDFPKHHLPGTKKICLAGMKIKDLLLPPNLEIYREAIMAALLKANCYHCTHVHFSK